MPFMCAATVQVLSFMLLPSVGRACLTKCILFFVQQILGQVEYQGFAKQFLVHFALGQTSRLRKTQDLSKKKDTECKDAAFRPT